MKTISSGAEAIIYLNDNKNIEKQRIEKSYRIKEIDSALRVQRNKKEAKILKKLSKIIPVPKILSLTDTSIEMEYIDGIKLREILDKKPEYAQKIAENLSLMHDSNIIHGDLTTSNMILFNEKIYFIDFGLSFESSKIEDKAVDIHLFKQALNSKHYKVADVAYKYFLKGYNPKNREEILKRLKTVEQRGRYKEKT
ncbi:MAG: KEOPS complex kinase/ATPase Bud32 [Candidatus Woesearchaeota archaeon]